MKRLFTTAVLAVVLVGFSQAFGVLVTDDFDNNDDGRFLDLSDIGAYDPTRTLDFTPVNQLDIYPIRNSTGGTQWFYVYDKVDMATPAWVPPAYDFTGATISFEEKWDIVNDNGRVMTNQILQFRVYSGTYDSGTSAWTMTGYETWNWPGEAPPAFPEDTWIQRNAVQGTGTVGGAAYDPSSIYYWRWFGTDWDQVDGDKVSLRNFAVMPIPEPSTIMMIGTGLIGLLALLKRKK